ncbi:MAG: nascent polypeptide-associated complex protein [Thermoplasmata archaeon]|jgi:nascent polypeptide-associated complex subunit alpha|nr:nascent polypeptide-associated complex protein [Thermoplasmata archaeon]
MLPMDDKQLKIMMKRMGITMKELKAKRVIIETEDKEYIFKDPVVSVMEVKGEKTYQIAGDAEVKMKVSEDDIALVMEKTGRSREEARKALEEADGDIAQAILNLSS